jgi:hypothetical protein
MTTSDDLILLTLHSSTFPIAVLGRVPPATTSSAAICVGELTAVSTSSLSVSASIGLPFIGCHHGNVARSLSFVIINKLLF